jgi:hypothetical protein
MNPIERETPRPHRQNCAGIAPSNRVGANIVGPPEAARVKPRGFVARRRKEKQKTQYWTQRIVSATMLVWPNDETS